MHRECTFPLQERAVEHCIPGCNGISRRSCSFICFKSASELYGHVICTFAVVGSHRHIIFDHTEALGRYCVDYDVGRAFKDRSLLFSSTTFILVLVRIIRVDGVWCMQGDHAEYKREAETVRHVQLPRSAMEVPLH